MRQVRCPVCGAAVTWADTSPWRPFCSERCRLIDLGDWAAGRHVIRDDPEPDPAPPGGASTPA